jgi:hypothetical protein
VLDVEAPLYVASLAFVASGKARLDGGKVRFGSVAPAT